MKAIWRGQVIAESDRMQFYDVIDSAAQSRRAAWSYEAPRTGMQQVDHWIAFWEDVEIK